MIDIFEKYSAIIFMDASDIIPNHENITKLMNIFKDKELIPNTFNEISPKPSKRIRFSSSNNEWEILFGTQRINIDKNPIEPKGTNLGKIDNFCSESVNIFERLLNEYKKKANRISINANYLLKEMPIKRLEKVYLQLFKPPQFYIKTIPFEWNWRTASQIPIDLSNVKDSLNVITSISRVSGYLRQETEVIPIDRLHLLFDINTHHSNKDFRFETNHIKTFYESALKYHDDLLKEIMEYINEQ